MVWAISVKLDGAETPTAAAPKQQDAQLEQA